MALPDIGKSSCFNCRTRKVRCDRVFPRCSQCKNRDLECLAPEAPPRMVWLPPRTVEASLHDPEDVEVDMHVRRQPLFKRTQQARNAASLLSLTLHTSVGPMLEQVELQADGVQSGGTIVNGPFCAFRCEQNLPPSPLPSAGIAGPLDHELWPPLSHAIDDALYLDDIIQLPWSPNAYIPDEDPMQTADVCGNDGEFSDSHSAASELSPSASLVSLGLSRSSPADLRGLTMSTAKLLLDHYQNSVVHIYTPARVESKSPWEILYVPNVLSTLGEIALTGNSGNAKVALLFAVFAISAFSLDVLPASDDGFLAQNWRALGNLYRERATKRLQLSLRELSAGHTKKEKYKNILMPLLSMVTISVVSGEMRNAAHYLGDIEQIITLYGIPKSRKSRKVKMLHCIYLYLRVLTESPIIHDRIINAAPEKDTGPNSTPSPAQNLSTWDMLLRESSHSHDVLNLDFMQNLTAAKSTFEQIYSVPESLFRLILETTQLAREVSRLRAHQRPINIDHDTLSSKIKQLENSICDWESQYQDDVSTRDSINAPSKESFPYHLIRAIYAALMIYFYRCVRDVNAVALQPYVQQTIHHLLEYDKQKQRYKDQSSDICWPGFIAGCEATRPQSRQQISEWLEKSARSTGMRMFTVALQAVQKVWAARSVPGKQNVSWSNILGEFTDLRVLVLS